MNRAAALLDITDTRWFQLGGAAPRALENASNALRMNTDKTDKTGGGQVRSSEAQHYSIRTLTLRRRH
jgi:hypothetical protein